ncbi:MAG: class III extradiol ring-cleavage dioxygenase [Pseudomonadota bacterium]
MTIMFFPHGGGPLPLMNHDGHANMIRFLQEFPNTVAKPDAIVVIGAHWEEPTVSITASPAPPMLYDYYGFPPETYEIKYSSPGAPALAGRIAELLRNAGVDSRLDKERGYDHSVFVPLMLMYPDADIPCIEISLHDSLDAEMHVRIGKALSSLRSENILVLGSGFSFHNMRVMLSKRGDAVDPHNEAFEDWLAETLQSPDLDNAERERRLINWEESAPHARYCHPREEHLLPLQVCYGMAGGPGKIVFDEPIVGFRATACRWD